MAPIEFRAPWNKTLRIATLLSTAVLLITITAGVASYGHAPLLASLALVVVPLLTLAGTMYCMVRGYVLTEHAITVQRLGWATRLPLAGLQSVEGNAEAMCGSIRVLGNGGLFSFTGEFWNRRLGRYRALATDPARAVVLRYPKRTIVITPHDPQQFIVRARTLLKHAQFEAAHR